VAVTWDEAFAEIEARLLPVIEAHGAQSVASILGNPVAHHYGLAIYAQRWLRTLGSPNVFSASTVDQMPKQLANAMLYGGWLSNAVPDIARTDLLIILGGNPAASNGSMWTIPDFKGQVKALKARGGKMVVIDPRRTETADMADAHHFIRPAGDIYLLLGIVNVIFAENLIRLGRLEGMIAGVEALKVAVSAFTPDLCAPHCGMTAQTIRQLARDLYDTPRAVLYGRIGTCLQRFGTLNSWLIDVINILNGHLDTEGGAMFAKAPAFAANARGKPGSGRGLKTGRRLARVSGAPEVMGEFPVS
jgi:anaerobic selenocysteine-containing dehydrogenase